MNSINARIASEKRQPVSLKILAIRCILLNNCLLIAQLTTELRKTLELENRYLVIKTYRKAVRRRTLDCTLHRAYRCPVEPKIFPFF